MTAGPLSRPLIVSTVPEQGLSVEVVADEAERAALAAVNEVESIERLTARLEVRPQAGGVYSVRGTLSALATRLCVVTLDPFVEPVEETVDVRFAPPSEIAATAGAFGSEDDPPDEIVGGAIDLGAVVAEFFTLGLDAYPRKPGATFADDAGGDDEGSPFAALRRLRPRSGEPD